MDFTLSGIIKFTIRHWQWIAMIGAFSIYAIRWIFLHQYEKYMRILQGTHGYILIGGRFAAGKTRLMSLFAKEARARGKFVITNFANGYKHLRFMSVRDLYLLLVDIMVVSEYQNHSDDEIKKVYDGMGEEYMKKKLKERAMLRKKYPYIPNNGRATEFWLGGDEFHAYFYSRLAMSNFSGEFKDFNVLLHQVRHFNLQGVFATQELDDLDKKFRTLANYEIETFDWLGGIIMGFNLYHYNAGKKYDEEEKQFLKITRIPVTTYNGYVMNKLIYWCNFSILDRINRLLSRVSKVNLKIGKRIAQLDFYSKSNINPVHDIYAPGDLFRALDKFYLVEIEDDPIEEKKEYKYQKKKGQKQ